MEPLGIPKVRSETLESEMDFSFLKTPVSLRKSALSRLWLWTLFFSSIIVVSIQESEGKEIRKGYFLYDLIDLI